MRSGSRREGSGGHRQHVVSSSRRNPGVWAYWGRVLGSCEQVGDFDPSLAGMGRRMGRCRTGWTEVRTCLISCVENSR